MDIIQEYPLIKLTKWWNLPWRQIYIVLSGKTFVIAIIGHIGWLLLDQLYLIPLIGWHWDLLWHRLNWLFVLAWFRDFRVFLLKFFHDSFCSWLGGIFRLFLLVLSVTFFWSDLAPLVLRCSCNPPYWG